MGSPTLLSSGASGGANTSCNTPFAGAEFVSEPVPEDETHPLELFNIVSILREVDPASACAILPTMNLQKPVTDQTLLLSKEEAGRLLAVSTRTIDRLLQDGVLPAVRLRRRILVSREAILALVRGEQE